MFPSLTTFLISTIICIAWIDVVMTKNGDCTDLNLVKMNSCAVASQTQMEPSLYCNDKFGFNVRARDMPSYDRTNLTDLQYLYDYEMCLCNGYTSLAKCWKYICPADESGILAVQSANDACAKAQSTNADGVLKTTTGTGYTVINSTDTAKSSTSKMMILGNVAALVLVF